MYIHLETEQSVPLLYDTLVFLCVGSNIRASLLSPLTIPDPYSLTARKTYELWKKRVTTPLLDVIWKDGVLYFFVTFSSVSDVLYEFIETETILRQNEFCKCCHLLDGA
jgi:hypothetical protein